MNTIILTIDPFMARKVQIVAMEKNIPFDEALFFLVQSVITPNGESNLPPV